MASKVIVSGNRGVIVYFLGGYCTVITGMNGRIAQWATPRMPSYFNLYHPRPKPQPTFPCGQANRPDHRTTDHNQIDGTSQRHWIELNDRLQTVLLAIRPTNSIEAASDSAHQELSPRYSQRMLRRIRLAIVTCEL